MCEYLEPQSIAQEAHKLSRKTAAVLLADTYAVADTDGDTDRDTFADTDTDTSAISNREQIARSGNQSNSELSKLMTSSARLQLLQIEIQIHIQIQIDLDKLGDNSHRCQLPPQSYPILSDWHFWHWQCDRATTPSVTMWTRILSRIRFRFQTSTRHTWQELSQLPPCGSNICIWSQLPHSNDKVSRCPVTNDFRLRTLPNTLPLKMVEKGVTNSVKMYVRQDDGGVADSTMQTGIFDSLSISLSVRWSVCPCD